MTPRHKHKSMHQPGYLLLMVLVFVFLASIASVALLESSVRNIRTAAAASARDDLRITAFSALEISLATLSEIKELDGQLVSPAQSWGDPISYAPVEWPNGMKGSVQIIDETGKIPIASPERETLQQLLEQFGVEYTEADELIDAYLDWTDEDDLERINGAEADYYERQEPSVKPPNAPISSYEAFRYIKGFKQLFFNEDGSPNGKFKVFKESTSLKHDYELNLNTASSAVRAMLQEHNGLDPNRLEDLEYGLDGIPGTADDGYIKNSDELFKYGISGNAGVGFEAHVFRIVVRVEQGEKRFQLTALIDDGGSSNNGSASDGGGGTEGGDSPEGGDPSEGDGAGDNNRGKNPEGNSTDDEVTVLYTIGDWRFLELTENGPEDG